MFTDSFIVGLVNRDEQEGRKVSDRAPLRHNDGRSAMDVRAAENAISRRNAVVRIGAGAGLSLALVTRSGAVFARQSTPSAEGELPPAMASFISALEATDPDRLAASYAPDGVLEEVGF